MSERKTSNKSKSNNFLKLQAFNLVIYLILFVLFSVVSVIADIKKENMVYISVVFLSLCSFVSGFIAGIKERKNGIICGVISALPMNVLLIIVSMIVNGFKIDFFLLASLLSAVVFSAIGGIVSVNLRLK